MEPNIIIPRKYFQNPDVRFEIWDTQGRFLYTGENILDGICSHYKDGDLTHETYSFRPINSGVFDFWCESTEIVDIRSSSDINNGD